MTRVLVLLGASIAIDAKQLADRVQATVVQNKYVEDEDVIMLYDCPNSPTEVVEVDVTIGIGTCSEHDPFSFDVTIDENGDFTTDLIDTLIELYNAEAEAFSDGE